MQGEIIILRLITLIVALLKKSDKINYISIEIYDHNGSPVFTIKPSQFLITLPEPKTIIVATTT